MEVKAVAKHIKISPQKTRLVVNLLRGKKALEAAEELKFIPKKASKPVLKVINSAIANAEHNFNLAKDKLFIHEIYADEGPSYKRVKYRARGGRDIIKKRTTHITVILKTTETAKEAKKAEVKSKEAKEALKAVAEKTKKIVTKKEEKPVAEKEEVKKEEKIEEKKVEEKPTIKEPVTKVKEKKEKKAVSQKQVKKPASKAKTTKPEFKQEKHEHVKEQKSFLQKFFRRKGGM